MRKMRPSLIRRKTSAAAFKGGLLCLSALWLVGCRTLTVPLATVDQRVVTLPDVLRGDVVSHTFTVSNDGDDLLTIEFADTNCTGVVTLSAKRVRPGGSSRVTVSFDSRGIPENTVAEFPVVLRTNDPSQRELTLLTRVAARSEWVLSDSLIDLSDRADRPETRTIRITMAADQPVLLMDPRTSVPGVRVAIDRRRSTPGREYLMDITVSGEALTHSYVSTIVIPTSSRLSPEIRIPILRLPQ